MTNKSWRMNKKGFALIMVFGIVIFMVSAVVNVMVVMNAKMEDLKATIDRTMARSACEAGASVAVMAIAAGKTGSSTFTYNVGKRPCKITYYITNTGGSWKIKVTTPSPMGFATVYTLEVAGQRAVPFFIKGPGALM